MKPAKHDPLLNELLADESLEAVRRQSLEQGLAIARRRRQTRGWAKGGLGAAVLLGVLALLVSLPERPRLRHRAAQRPAGINRVSLALSAPPTHAPPAVRFISDEELLALFPGRAVALVGPSDRKTLLFLDQLPSPDPTDDPAQP